MLISLCEVGSIHTCIFYAYYTTNRYYMACQLCVLSEELCAALFSKFFPIIKINDDSCSRHIYSFIASCQWDLPSAGCFEDLEDKWKVEGWQCDDWDTDSDESE